jgi:hypothetical protein
LSLIVSYNSEVSLRICMHLGTERHLANNNAIQSVFSVNILFMYIILFYNVIFIILSDDVKNACFVIMHMFNHS